MRKKILLLLLTLLSASLGYAQLSTEGKQFWVGFLRSATLGNHKLRLVISSKTATTVTISMPGTTPAYTPVTLSVSPFVPVIHDINPATYGYSVNEGTIRRGIFVNAVDDISVTAMNQSTNRTEASAVLPVKALGSNTEYIITGYLPTGSDRSVFCVVGLHDNTSVTITPKVATSGGNAAGVPFTRTINRGDVLQIISAAATDFTGTTVKANGNCVPFAVFSGVTSTRVTPTCGGSYQHLYEQQFPLHTWGKEYRIAPFKRSTSGHVFRIVASQDTTSVTISNGNGLPQTITLNKGQFFDTEMTSLLDLTKGVCVSANKPIAVAQYMKTSDCNGTNPADGDATFLMLNPIDQTTKKVAFNTAELASSSTHHVNVIIKTTAVGTLKVDDVLQPASAFTAFGDCDNYSYGQFDISHGAHKLESDSSFIAFIYGYGGPDAYSYSVGATFDNLAYNFSATPAASCFTGSNTVTFAGVGTGVLSWNWNFGDGNTASGQNPPAHTYTTPGVYDVKMIVGITGGCGTDTVTRSVEVIPYPTVNLGANRTICIGTSTTLTAPTLPSGSPFTYTYQWIKNGVNIAGATNATYTVNGTVAGTDSYAVKIISNSLCSTTSAAITVTVSAKPSNAVTPASATFCLGSTNTLTGPLSPVVSQPYVYQWIKDGIVISGATNRTLTVSETGGYRLVVTNSSGCTDSSAIVPVTVTTPPVATITANGGRDYFCSRGSLLLSSAVTPAGTGISYTYQWRRNGLNIAGATSTTYNAAIAGDYTLVATSVSTNCKDTSNVLTIRREEAPAAAITADKIAMCNLDTARLSTIIAPAGVTYTYQWTRTSTPFAIVGTNSPNLNVTTAGTYTVKIINTTTGCDSTSVPVQITVYPLPVATASASSTVFCQNDSTLLSTPSGAGWSYQWIRDNVDMAGVTTNSFFVKTTGDYKVRVTSLQGCVSVSNTVSITVNPLPVVDIPGLQPGYCANESAVTLSTIASPDPATGTGVFSIDGGPAVTELDPAALPGGNHTLTYTFTDPATGCVNSITKPFVINTLLPIQFTNLNSAYCVNDAPVVLTATPDQSAGGTGVFQINGVNATELRPNVLSLSGTDHRVSYIYTFANGCVDSTFMNVRINPLPIVNIINLDTAYCRSSAAVLLSGTPAGGTFSVNGQDTTHFNPASASIIVGGYNLVRYRYTDANGCENALVREVMVNPLPAVRIDSLNAEYCAESADITLVGIPRGGSFFIGRTIATATTPETMLRPQSLGAGTFVVRYVFTDAKGCTNSTMQVVKINPTPAITINNLDPTYCKDVARVEFEGFVSNYPGQTTPPRGIKVFTLDGQVIATPVFSPATLALGTHEIKFSFTDSITGCSRMVSRTFEIKALPVVNITGLLPYYCQNDNSFTPVADVPGGKFYLDNNAADITLINPRLLSAGTHRLIYRYQDNFSCVGADTAFFEIRPVIKAEITGVLPYYCVTDAAFALTADRSGGLFRINGMPVAGATNLMFDPAFLRAGKHTITYHYTVSGCTAIDTFTTKILDAPIVNLGSDIYGCESQNAITLNAEHPSHTNADNLGMISYLWNTGATTPSITVTTSGTYIVSVKHQLACAATRDTIVVDLKPRPIVDLGADREVCGGDSVTLNAKHLSHTAAFKYKWNTGATTPTIKVAGRGISYYSVVVTDETYPSKCQSTDEVRVTFKDALVMKLGADVTVCDPTQLPYLIKGTDPSHVVGTTYQWVDPVNPATVLSTQGNLSITKAGLYKLTATHPNGCSVTDTIQIFVNPDPVISITGANAYGTCQKRDTLTVQVTNVLNMTVAWTGPGIIYTDPSKLWVIVDKTGKYSVTVTDNSKPSKCSTTKSVETFLADFPVATISPATPKITVCQDSIINFTVVDASHLSTFKYQWRELQTGAIVSSLARFDLNAASLKPGATFDAVKFVVTVTPPSGCVSYDTVEVQFQKKPTALIDKNYPRQICLGQSFTLKASGADSYKWTIPDTGSGASSTSTNPMIVINPKKAGVYRIIMQANFVSSTGCKPAYDTATVTVNPALVAKLPQDKITVCEDETISLSVFDDSHPFSVAYQWRSLAPNRIIGNSATLSFGFKNMIPEPSYASRKYEVEVRDPLTGCSARDTIEITFLRKSNAKILDNYPRKLCVGQEGILRATGGGKYTWSTGDTTQTAKIKEDSTGIYQYILKAAYNNSCSPTYDTVYVEVIDKPTARANSVKLLNTCIGQSVTLTASGGTSYLWDHGDRTASTTVRPARDTWYKVSVFNETGCFSRDSVRVTVTPVIDLPTRIIACEGDTVRINGTHADSTAQYMWSDGDTARVKIVTRRAGIYTLRVRVQSCEFFDSTEVVFKVKPRIQMAKDTLICFAREDEQELKGRQYRHEIVAKISNRQPGETYVYEWYKKEGNTFLERGRVAQTGEIRLEIARGEGTGYVLKVRNSAGCQADSQQIAVREVCEPRVRIPSAFTPNGDGLNDVFAPLAHDIEGINIKIYQRWGNVVFEKNIEKGGGAFDFDEQTDGWDGTLNGKHCPMDAYQYVIVYWGRDSKGHMIRKSFSGTLQLIREVDK